VCAGLIYASQHPVNGPGPDPRVWQRPWR
jgi:hypothetical protein